MIKGYAINQQRLDYLEKTVKLIDIANRLDEQLDNGDAREVIKVIGKERDELFKGILGNIYQSFSGQELYPLYKKKEPIYFIYLLKIILLLMEIKELQLLYSYTS